MDLSLSLPLIRFTAGLLLIGQGAQKLIGIGPGSGLERWTANVRDMGFRPASLWASLSISALMVGQLFVAIAKADWAKGLWVQASGYEHPLLLMSSPSRSADLAATPWMRRSDGTG